MYCIDYTHDDLFSKLYGTLCLGEKVPELYGTLIFITEIMERNKYEPE